MTAPPAAPSIEPVGSLRSRRKLFMAIDQGVRSKKETRADAQSVIDLAHKQGLKIVDLKFIDLIGTWQHFSIPVQELSKSLFSEGIGFDGSTIRGFQHIPTSHH